MTAFHLLSEEPCRFNHSLCWRIDQTPDSNQRSNDSLVIGFAWAVTSEKAYVRCFSTILVVLISTNTSAPTAGCTQILKHAQEADHVLALSPGLGGRRKCWYMLWSWRPRPSHFCQMSWGQQSRADIWHVLQFQLSLSWHCELERILSMTRVRAWERRQTKMSEDQPLWFYVNSTMPQQVKPVSQYKTSTWFQICFTLIQSGCHLGRRRH